MVRLSLALYLSADSSIALGVHVYVLYTHSYSQDKVSPYLLRWN